MKILIAFLLFVSLGHAQDVKATDFSQEDGRMRFKDKSFNFKNGNGQMSSVSTSIFMSEKEFKDLKIETINKMLLIANEKAPGQLKNKSTYNPNSIRMDLSQADNTWRVWIEYTAQNDFGATKDGSVFVFYNLDGTYKNTVNL